MTEKHGSRSGLWRVWHREALARMYDTETHCVSGCILSNGSPPPLGSGKFMSALEFDTICQAMELAA